MGLAHSTLFTHFVFHLQPVESSILVTDSCRCCIKYCFFLIPKISLKMQINSISLFKLAVISKWNDDNFNHHSKFIFRILRGTECELHFQKSIYLHQIFCNQIPYIVKTGRWNLIFREKLNSKSTTTNDFFFPTRICATWVVLMRKIMCFTDSFYNMNWMISMVTGLTSNTNTHIRSFSLSLMSALTTQSNTNGDPKSSKWNVHQMTLTCRYKFQYFRCLHEIALCGCTLLNVMF